MSIEGQPQPSIQRRLPSYMYRRLEQAGHIASLTIAAASLGLGSYYLVDGEMALQDHQTASHSSPHMPNSPQEVIEQGTPAYTAFDSDFYNQQILTGKIGIGMSILMSSVTLALALRKNKRPTPEHNPEPGGVPFKDFLAYLNAESSAITDAELTRYIPDIYSEAGQEVWDVPSGEHGMYTERDHINWEQLEPGDIFRGTFRIFGASAMTQALDKESQDFVVLVANRSDCERDTSAPTMHIRMPRTEFLDNIDAIHKLTAYGLTMDMSVEARARTKARDQALHPIVATPVRILGMEQPFQPEQLHHGGKDKDYLIAGTIRSVSIRDGATWLDIEASDGAVRQVRSEGNVLYFGTITGQPYPFPQEGDTVHLVAGIDPEYSTTDDQTVFKHISAYRIAPKPGGETLDMEYYGRIATLLSDVSHMYTADTYDAFRAAAGELMRMHAHGAFRLLARKYSELFPDNYDIPVALENHMQTGSLMLLHDAFPLANITVMTRSQFKDFGLAAARGEQAPQPGTAGSSIIAKELFATKGRNPELIRVCLEEIIPAIVEGELRVKPFQVEILKNAVGNAVRALPHLPAAQAIARAVALSLRAREQGSDEARHTFEALADSLKAALQAGVTACKPTQTTSWESSEAITLYRLARKDLRRFNERHKNR